MEVADFHGGDDHLKGFFAGRADGRAKEFDVVEHFNERLVEAEVANGGSNLTVFNEKEAVAGHPGHYLFIGVDFANVPKAGDEEAAIGGGHHLVEGGVATAEDEVHGGFAVLVGENEAVAGGLLAGSFGSGAGVDEILGDAAIDEMDTLAGDPFAVERGALLQRMINVIGDGDVLTEELFAHAVVEAGALVFEGGGGEIVKKEADEIENGSGLENDGVTAGGEFSGVDGEMAFLGGTRGESLWVERADVARIGFGPAGGRAFLNGDGKFGVGFAIGGEEAAGVTESGLVLAIRINSGGDLAILDRQIAGTAHGAGSFLGGESGGRLDKAIYAAIALLCGHGEKAGIFRLAVGK